MGFIRGLLGRNSRYYTPDTLPQEYKALMFLTLLEIDCAIGRTAASEEQSWEIQEASNTLFDFASEFIFSANQPLVYENLVSCAGNALDQDHFEMELRLARVFLNALAKTHKKIDRFNLATLLGTCPSFWKQCLEATLLCGIFSKHPYNKDEIEIQAKFFKKYLAETENSNFLTAPFPLISINRALYFFHYCHSSSSILLSNTPNEEEYGSICRYIFELYKIMYGRLIATMAVVRIYQRTSTRADLARLHDRILEMRKIALFDRTRRAFDKSLNQTRQIVFPNPDQNEEMAIFKKNAS